jgi:bacterioferritin
MHGNPDVIARLNDALREELTAINQYFVHAEMCHNWGYHRLGNYIKKQSIGEMKHAEELLERILFLDGTPNMQQLPLNIGQDVRSQLQNDLNLEVKAVTMYNEAVKLARDLGDNASRELFERLLKDEEQHVDFLEAQVHQIKELGYERYLAQQVGGEES